MVPAGRKLGNREILDTPPTRCYRLALPGPGDPSSRGSMQVAGQRGRGIRIVAKKIELGTKHECESCGGKFYDLGVPDKPCPLCGFDAKAAAAEEQGSNEEE